MVLGPTCCQAHGRKPGGVVEEAQRDVIGGCAEAPLGVYQAGALEAVVVHALCLPCAVVPAHLGTGKAFHFENVKFQVVA